MDNNSNNPDYSNAEVHISWDGILSVVMRKYVRWGLEVDKFCLPKKSYDAVIQKLNQKFGGSEAFVYGLSKNDSYDFFVSYPQWIEELDCKGEEILPKFKNDMIKIFFHYYDDEFIQELRKEGQINLNVYGKQDPDRIVWAKEDGEARVILQNVAWLAAVRYQDELEQEKKQNKNSDIPSEEKQKVDEEIRNQMCEEVKDEEYHTTDSSCSTTDSTIDTTTDTPTNTTDTPTNSTTDTTINTTEEDINGTQS